MCHENTMERPWKFKENFHGQFMGHDLLQPIKNLWTLTPWNFGLEIHGFLSTFEKAMKCHFHEYFKASRSLYSIFHGSWILKFSQVFHGIFQVFFMALRPWKCHWFKHENPVKNLWIYNELLHKIFMGFDFIVMCSQYINPGLWLLWMTLLRAINVQAGVVKKVCIAFSLVQISFSKNLVYPAYAEF